MGLGSLLSSTRSKPKCPKTCTLRPEEEKEKEHKCNKISFEPNANVAYPCYEAKGTVFPLPLSIDASISTDPLKIREIILEGGQESGDYEKIQKSDQQATKELKKEEEEQKRIPENCENDISPIKLTEMIDCSINKAMQSIVKQCRMEQKESNSVKNLEKKAEIKMKRSVCYSKEEVPLKIKNKHQSHSMGEQFSTCSKSCKLHDDVCFKKRRTLQEKFSVARPRSKKLSEAENFHKKETVHDDAKSKRHTKSANNARRSTKTDNRRMTGNVNIYICSEGIENAQGKNKAHPAHGTSSKTGTEHSNHSSRAQSPFDLLDDREESASNCSEISCATKYSEGSTLLAKLRNDDFTDASTPSTDEIRPRNTNSAFIECPCKAVSSSDVTLDKSNISAERSKLMCDVQKFARPCPAICPTRLPCDYSVNGEEWSSKSVCNNMDRAPCCQDTSCAENYEHYKNRKRVVLCDNKPEYDPCLLKSICANKYPDGSDVSNEEKYARSKTDCCCKEDPVPAGKYSDWMVNNANALKKCALRALQRRNLVHQWPTCSRIAEEDEEDYCSERKSSEFTPCRTATSGVAVCEKLEQNSESCKEKYLEGLQKCATQKENSLKIPQAPIISAKLLEERDARECTEKTFKEKVMDSFLCRALKRVLISPKSQDKVEKDQASKCDPCCTMKVGNDRKETIEKKLLPACVANDIKRMGYEKGKIISTKFKNSENENKRPPGTCKNITNAKLIDKEKKKSMTMYNECPRYCRPTIHEKILKYEMRKKNAINAEKLPKILTIIANKKNLVSMAAQRDPDSKPTTSGKSRKVSLIPEPQVPEKDVSKTGEFKIACEIPVKLDKITPKKRSGEDIKMDCRLDSWEKEAKEPGTLQCKDDGMDIRTKICSTSKYNECSDIKKGLNINDESDKSNHIYYSSAPQNSNAANYRKSCLKATKSSYNTKKTDQPYIDSCGNWDCCTCRNSMICGNCCKSNNECSCRQPTICLECCKPKVNCNCKSLICEIGAKTKCEKSMYCLYCDNPRERCICRPPEQKCSYCEFPTDLCKCEEIYTDSRPILTDPENDHDMYVTSWKPRKEVRRYCSRNLDDIREDSNNECCFHEKLKPQGLDDLPYQRLSVFSDVMDELQQKISESVCCTHCRKIPCRCSVAIRGDEERDGIKFKCCVSPKAVRKFPEVRIEKCRSKSSNTCECNANSPINDQQSTIMPPLACCDCKVAPCNCRKNVFNPKKPRAKCYYCKNSPCVCIAPSERNKSRTACRCADSPCRTKEKEIMLHGKVSSNSNNKEEKVICVH